MSQPHRRDDQPARYGVCRKTNPEGYTPSPDGQRKLAADLARRHGWETSAHQGDSQPED